MEKDHIETLVINNEHAFQAGQLPMHHKDPFDRMLAAQAQVKSLGLISNDPKLQLYDMNIFW